MFQKYQTLLRWWTLFCIQVISIGIAAYFGLIFLISASDPTYLTFTIITLHFLITLYIGYVIYKIDTKNIQPNNNVINWLYFWCDRAAPGLGILGLVVGIIIIFGPAFQGLNVADLQSVAAVIKAIGYGVGTKLFATASGVISALLIDFQVRLIGVSE